MKVVLLGNHTVPFSTESHHAWTWEKLGHQVVRLQENSSSTDQVVKACEGAQLFQYTHTHGWHTPGSFSEEEMVRRVRALGVKSFSYHLDYYHGLDTWDKRHSLVGKHPSWKVDHWFSTDGGHDAFFRERGVNHHYLPPGVVEYGCYMAKPKGAPIDVLFAGSVNYHPEYPFRSRMVEALRARYGGRFTSVQGYREEKLNDLYASAKVVVGDHVFAGDPLYWSDRLPETCGRGGFIVYPKIEGMTIPTATYEAQNAPDLISKVDYFLEHQEEREEIRRKAFEHVRANDTYTHRLAKIAEIMGVR